MSETLSTDSVECHDVRRCFVLKRKSDDPKGASLLAFVQRTLGCQSVSGIRTGIRYDTTGVNNDQYERVQQRIFAEMPVNDILTESEFAAQTQGATTLLIESLPGQYNQLSDWAEQSIAIESGAHVPVRTAECIIIEVDLPHEQLEKLQTYLINPTDSREASAEKPNTLDQSFEQPGEVATLTGFTMLLPSALRMLLKDHKLAMTEQDLANVQTYFANRKHRDPTITELKVIDTYWSDHCRHTTFTTELTKFTIDGASASAADGTPVQRAVQNALQRYMTDRREVHEENESENVSSLMDLALMNMKLLKKRGQLEDMEDSEENNAASIVVPVTFDDGRTEQWLFLFKNETHNHPTEIEPLGGAATCIGGAIRDPLSGRARVFMGMRLTGSGNPLQALDQTLPGKLPQRRITTGAAEGFSGYGNQIGVPTHKVMEVYHEGYRAKRLECGFVGGAVPLQQVRRERPAPGDLIILLGGRTGRDGIGGASGSSKEHTESSTATCGAEVQKGDAPQERKIQRLFSDPGVSAMIKRCNDFGAGGVSVAIGELADGLSIDLDKVLVKYQGLDATELAISESQERMAVVISREDLEKFLASAEAENLEATVVAEVNDSERLVMQSQGKTVCDLDRDFLNGGWAKRTATVDMRTHPQSASYVSRMPKEVSEHAPLKCNWLENLRRMNVCSKRGLQQRFDSTVGANTVLQPFGGQYQLSPSEAAVVKFPAPGAQTAMATSIGFDPDFSAESPLHGAAYAVVDSVARIVASGGDFGKVRLTLQNYFEKLGADAQRWGKPMLAQLGAYVAQRELGIAAIGGKDSMSGTFTYKNTDNNTVRLDVPPTLVSFAVAPIESDRAIGSAFEKSGSTVVHLPVEVQEDGLPNWDQMKKMWSVVQEYAKKGLIRSAHAVHDGGIAAALSEMSVGNRIGIALTESQVQNQPALFSAQYGSIVVELAEGVAPDTFGTPSVLLGHTIEAAAVAFGKEGHLTHQDLLGSYESPLDSVFPVHPEKQNDMRILEPRDDSFRTLRSKSAIGKPRVSVLTLPGTNCENETANTFRLAGATHVDIPVFVNLTRRHVEDSMKRFADAIDHSQIVVFPGGFSAGDQPDGSGKFGAAVLRNARVADALACLKEREGLVLGICNGFQILMKACMFKNGTVDVQRKEDMTLTHNDMGHFLSFTAPHRASSVRSPWMAEFEAGEIADFPIAHGEGKLINVPSSVWEKGQVPFQYAGNDGNVRMSFPGNPNGSQQSIAALTDPSGLVFGMMAHPERAIPGLSRNVPGDRKGLKLLRGGLSFFS